MFLDLGETIINCSKITIIEKHLDKNYIDVYFSDLTKPITIENEKANMVLDFLDISKEDRFLEIMDTTV